MERVPRLFSRKTAVFVALTMLGSVTAVRAGAPQRAVSLVPALTETVYAIGAGEALVGVGFAISMILKAV